MIVNLDDTVAVTRAATIPVLPGFTTSGTVCGCIKRNQVSNQKVRMMAVRSPYVRCFRT